MVEVDEKPRKQSGRMDRAATMTEEYEDPKYTNLQKKLKILKKGIKEERKKNEEMEAGGMMMQEKIRHLQQTINENENKCIKLERDKEELEDQLLINQEVVQQKKKPGSSLLKAFGINSSSEKDVANHIQAINLENEALKTQVLALQNVVNENEDFVTKTLGDQQLKCAISTDQNEKYKEELEKKEKEVEELKNNLRNLHMSNMNLLDQKTVLEETLEIISKKKLTLEEENIQLKEEKRERDIIFEKQRRYILKSEQDSHTMVDRLLEMKRELLELQTQSMIFSIIKIGTIRNMNCQLRFIKSEEEEYSMQIERHGKINKYPILDVELHQTLDKENKMNKFTLLYHSQKEYYESEESLKILDSFRDFQCRGMVKMQAVEMQRFVEKEEIKNEVIESVEVFLGDVEESKEDNQEQSKVISLICELFDI